MQTIFKLKADDLEKLANLISEIPNLAEDIMNDYLHNQGANIVIQEIKNEMPVGIHDTKKVKGYPQGHAKYSMSLEFTKMNLGFAVKTTKNPYFGYLYFPNFGEGTSKRNEPNQFFERGTEKGRTIIMNDLIVLLQSKIKEEFNNG